MSDYKNNEAVDTCLKHHERGCPSVAYQHVDVSIPVNVIPFARVDRIRIHCGGGTVINQGETHCNGKKDGVCSLTLSQTFCVEIPVNFGAAVELGDTFVECLGASTTSAFADYNEDDPL